MPSGATRNSPGQRNGRWASGRLIRSISTAPHTTTNANSVPMLTIFSRSWIGVNAATTAMMMPVMMVETCGVLNFSWTAPKTPFGMKPSRAIARKTRA